jgi:hypothetical protein
MCFVLLIIVILMAVSTPAIESAFVEQAVRNDAHQLSLMVKTAMLQSVEQHRVYVIDLTDTTMALHPQGDETNSDDAPPPASASASTNSDDADAQDGPQGVDVNSKLDPRNKLQVPDPDKKNAWVAMPPTSWVFQPGELCPASQVRFSRGDAWLIMSFNALTGNVENESTYFP